MAKPSGVGGGVNRAPTAASLSNSVVAENALGAQIGILTTTDPNKNDKITYQVLQTDSSGNLLLIAGQPVVDTRFSVDAAGVLKLASGLSLDYETTPIVNIVIRATDRGGLFKDERFLILVNNLNEAPTDITLANAAVDENAAAGTVVALLSATDQDANSTFTYALVTGNGTNDADNGLVTIVGNEVRVKSGALIDYESNPVLNLNVRVTDNGGLSYTEAVAIAVNDVNEGSGGEGQLAAPYSASPGYTPSLGTNLDGAAYYTTNFPYIDLMKQASAWIAHGNGMWDSGVKLDLDESGWVKALPVGIEAGIYPLLHNRAGSVTANARYVVTYEGQGTLVGNLSTKVIESSPGRMVIESAWDGTVGLKLTSTDPNNYLRDVHVVREDLLPYYEAGLTFNPDFVERVEDFGTFRFMDWMRTNSVFDTNGLVGWPNSTDAAPINWADRPLMTDARWDKGVPVEAIVEISNRTGSDAWFNMPINASDDYVRGFAAYVKEHLRPDLKIHLEYSNEVWNWAFPQSHYALARAQELWGPDAKWMEWYGMRAAQVGMIWNETFGESLKGDAGRVSIVYNTQFGWQGLETYGLETVHWLDASGNHIRAADYFDEYAITGYYGFDTSDHAVVRSWWSDADGGYAKALASLTNNVATSMKSGYEYHVAKASTYGLSAVTYESGYGMVASNETQDYIDFLSNVQRQPGIHDIEMQNYQAFKAAGGDLYMNFGIIGESGKWGSWSALESLYQETSPRYEALIDWNATVPPWYETDRDPVSFENARYYVAGDAGETIVGTLHGYDVLIGGAGGDLFVPYGSGSSLDGRGGIDTLMLPGNPIEYDFAQQSDGSILVSGAGGATWTVRDIEQVSFLATVPMAIDDWLI